MIKFSFADLSSFTNILHIIREKYNISIITESTPLQEITTENTRKAIVKTSKFEDFVDTFAEGFGYEVMRDAKGKRPTTNLVALRKIYDTIPDTPEVTESEILASLREIKQMTINFPRTNWRKVVLDFYESLTPQQIALAKEKKLPIASLSEKQSQYAEKVIVQIYMMKFNLPNEIDVLNSVVFYKKNSSLSGKQQSILYTYVKNYKQSSMIKTTDFLDINESPENKRLSSLLAQKKLPTTLQIGKELETKRCIALGCENIPSGAIARALDWMFGLRVTYMTQGFTRVTRRIPLKPSSIFDLHKALYQAVPAPIVRACDVSIGAQKMTAEIQRLDAKAQELLPHTSDVKVYNEWNSILQKRQALSAQSDSFALRMGKKLRVISVFSRS